MARAIALFQLIEWHGRRMFLPLHSCSGPAHYMANIQYKGGIWQKRGVYGIQPYSTLLAPSVCSGSLSVIKGGARIQGYIPKFGSCRGDTTVSHFLFNKPNPTSIEQIDYLK